MNNFYFLLIDLKWYQLMFTSASKNIIKINQSNYVFLFFFGGGGEVAIIQI